MRARPKDRRYLRWIGPADRQYGEHRGEPVELLGASNCEDAAVRFSDGTEAAVSWDHLTDVLFAL